MTFDDCLSLISEKSLCRVCEDLRKYPEFFRWPGAVGGMHHSYEKGLIIHTTEVVDYALKIADIVNGVNRDVLITAALWHDLAKIWDYQILTAWNAAPDSWPKKYVIAEKFEGGAKIWTYNNNYSKKIHHINGSCAEFTARAMNRVDRQTINSVQHAILAHHGPVKEWGSPVEPQSPEGIILHQADYLSASLGATKNSPPKE